MSSEREGNRWLRHHFHEFVFPAFMAAEKKSSEIGEPFNIKPSDKAPEILPTELKKLWTLCMEHNVPWELDVRERNVHSGSSKYRESARIHHDILQHTIDSAMTALRDEGCDRLFFGGRDVWTFAVLCSRRRIPYLFVPELSRNVSGRPAIKPFLEALGFTGSELFLDTGFAGSIPRSMQAHWKDRQFKFRLMSQSDVMVSKGTFGWVDQVAGNGKPPKKELPQYTQKPPRQALRPNQLFPNRAKAREEALETEYLAKYWRAGTTEATYPEGSPLVGHAPSVFAEWKNKTGVRRFVKPRNYPNISLVNPAYWLGIWDGKEAILIGQSDISLAPGFQEWWSSLLKEEDHVFPDPVPIGERVVQYFSDRQTIQRAALLTSMLWRGIPFWKTAMRHEKKVVQPIFHGNALQLHQNNGVNIAAGSNLTNFTTGTHQSVYSFDSTQFTGTITGGITGSTAGYSMNAINTHPVNSVLNPQNAILQQMVMQAAASMSTQNHLSAGPPPEVVKALGPMPLPESQPAPIQPMPIIMIEQTP